MNGDSQDAKRQRQQPHDGVEHESKQRKRPTQDEQDDPQKESSHDHLTLRQRCTVTAKETAP